MIRLIDFHTHPYFPEQLAPGTWDFITRISPTVTEHGDKLRDPHYVADLLRQQGVEHAVVLPEHCPRSSGNVRTETVIELCRSEPKLFLPFASVDINTDSEPVALMQHYVDQGVRGLKLYPSYQFYYPNDQRLYPIYEICQRARIPVLLHIGSSVLPNTRLKYCDPIYLDDVAVDFPELTIVMAHGGRGFWYDTCAFLAGHKANVYIDLAGLVPSRLLEYFPELERLSHKVVFGSDWPAMPTSIDANAQVIAGLGLTEAAQKRIFYENSARILGL